MLENSLRVKRIQQGFSQKALANEVGLTRQALYSIESNHYLPSTEVSLRLAKSLNCRVEDLFCLETGHDIVEAVLLEPVTESLIPRRANIARVGKRLIVKPVTYTGDMLNVMVPASGLLLSPISKGSKSRRAKSGVKVQVQLLQERQIIEEAIVIAGCDPGMYLAAEHLRRYRDGASVVGWTMSSSAAIEALKREEVHVAGLHLNDHGSGLSNMSYLNQHLEMSKFTVVRFATWEQGLLIGRDNPKEVRQFSDLARQDIRIVNREIGSGARLLMDGELAKAGLGRKHIRGYDVELSSHFQVARAIGEGKGDAGIGVEAAAQMFNLDFIPLREEHYDFVIPNSFFKAHPSLSRFLEVLVSRAFRQEMEAFGGYNMQEVGKVLTV